MVVCSFDSDTRRKVDAEMLSYFYKLQQTILKPLIFHIMTIQAIQNKIVKHELKQGIFKGAKLDKYNARRDKLQREYYNIQHELNLLPQ